MIKHQLYPFILVIGLSMVFSCQERSTEVTVTPTKYEGAIKNPLMGFTTRGIYDHPWASMGQTYIRWNEIEDKESDGIEKIREFCDQKWAGVENKNVKVIPRVYLHWSGDRKFWPSDMEEDDYSSPQFQKRVLRLVERLGECWDNDPRVAFVELGIFGKWGEQHSPFPTPEMEKMVGDAFAEAFQNKKVSVRKNWERFTHHPFGEYWDSWAHFDQMWQQGNSIKTLNDEGRYLVNYVGGETAYDWGNSDVQPGPSPTETMVNEKHRNFVINTLRWLHCTQLRWIENYDQDNEEAVKGAIEVQKAFGYRFELNEVRFAMSDSLTVSFDVTNTGSAPFYYDWPVEVALLDQDDLSVAWKAEFKSADIRSWHPGDGWTDPDWTEVDRWCEAEPALNWNESGESSWTIPPEKNTVSEKFSIDIPDGKYILSLAILDPAGNLPSVKFATGNYIKGARHPMGIVNLKNNSCSPLPNDFSFDDPLADNSLHYLIRK